MQTDPATVRILSSNRPVAAELSSALTARGIDAAVTGTDELLTALRTAPVDVIVLSQEQAGFLKGCEIVARLQKDLFYPEAILLGTLSTAERGTARQLGIQTILAEDCAVSDLVAAVLHCVSQLQASSAATPLAARRLVAGMEAIPPLPHVLAKLCGYLQDDSASLAELARDVSVDPRITAELLRLTNSTSVGLSRRVTSVQDAVSLLGVRRTVATIMSAAAAKVQSSLSQGIPHGIREWYQTRSVLIASVAACFAEQLETIPAETAHVLGLFQDLGVLALAQNKPRVYEQIWQRATQRGQVRIECLEREEFGLTHAEVSAALLERWELPLQLVTLVLNHHPPELKSDLTAIEQRFLHVMRTGEAVANLADVRAPHRQQSLQTLFGYYGAARTEDCKACIASATLKAKEYATLFSVPPPREEILQELLREVHCPSPVDQPEALSPPTTQAPASESLPGCEVVRGPKILVVDDDSQVVLAVRLVLKAAGYDVVTSQSAEQAIALAGDVDLILCDVHLQRANGIDLVQRFRAAGVVAPVIMMSGDAGRETVVKSIAAGIADYVIKPFTRERLVSKVQKALIERVSPPKPAVSLR